MGNSSRMTLVFSVLLVLGGAASVFAQPSGEEIIACPLTSTGQDLDAQFVAVYDLVVSQSGQVNAVITHYEPSPSLGVAMRDCLKGWQLPFNTGRVRVFLYYQWYWRSFWLYQPQDKLYRVVRFGSGREQAFEPAGMGDTLPEEWFVCGEVLSRVPEQTLQWTRLTFELETDAQGRVTGVRPTSTSLPITAGVVACLTHWRFATPQARAQVAFERASSLPRGGVTMAVTMDGQPTRIVRVED